MLENLLTFPNKTVISITQMDSMKKFVVGALVLFTFSIFTFPVFAASSTFFKKASEYYNKNCKKNIGKIDKSTAVVCYLFDKVTELQLQTDGLATRVGTIETSDASQSAKIIELEERLSALENSQPPASPSGLLENFNGPDLDTNIWEFFSTNGGNHSFDNGSIVVPGGSSMFYVRTKNNPFPPSGPFTVEFGIQFTSSAPSGDGVAVGFQQQNGYDPSNVPVSFWEDNASGLVVSRFGLKVADLAGGVDTNYHVGKIVYDGDKYLVYNDGILKYTSPSSATAKTIWFGNPYCCSSTWTGFKLDYMKVSSP